jgi:glycosyltransferase involved in cell wall biosynthesis
LTALRLALVSPRYGTDIVGGAETVCREYAERLSRRGHRVEVLTTCARDHFTWRNELPPGPTRINGVPVHRHPVTRPRDYPTMTVLHARMDAGFDLDEPSQRRWVESTGYSEPMMEAIAAAADRVDAIIFIPYLFASTVFGAAVRPDRSLVVPCLHDEAYARFGLIQRALLGARMLAFNSEAECELASRVLGELPPHRVVGIGFDEPPALDVPAMRARRGLPGDYVAFAGRREIGKNFPLLVEWIAAYSQGLSRNGPLSLAVAGTGRVDLPPSGRAVLRDLGFVSNTEKLEMFAGAVATATLSLNESFSFIIMESWSCGTPVVVHAGCEVTRRHCEDSGGGLWVGGAEEFAAALDRLRADGGLRDRLGAAGRDYVRRRYSWPAVLDRLEEAIQQVAS